MLYFNHKKHISQNGSFLVSCVCYILNVFVISVIVVIGMLYALLLGLQGFAFAFFLISTMIALCGEKVSSGEEEAGLTNL